MTSGICNFLVSRSGNRAATFLVKNGYQNLTILRREWTIPDKTSFEGYAGLVDDVRSFDKVFSKIDQICREPLNESYKTNSVSGKGTVALLKMSARYFLFLCRVAQSSEVRAWTRRPLVTGLDDVISIHSVCCVERAHK
jgi:hypothetical protein